MIPGHAALATNFTTSRHDDNSLCFSEERTIAKETRLRKGKFDRRIPEALGSSDVRSRGGVAISTEVYTFANRFAALCSVVMKWKRMLDFLYGSTPVEFESQFDLEESVRRLASATRRWPFGLFAIKQSAVGRVTARKVYLERVIPLVGNSFKPFFHGSFELVGGHVRLTGRFGFHPLVKVFMTFWFGFVVLWILFVTAHTIARLFDGKPCLWWLPFAGVGMFLAGLGLVAVGKWFARNDVRWLSTVIREALSREPFCQ
jgi:hypothetical protein